jgi:hypothetical protein
MLADILSDPNAKVVEKVEPVARKEAECHHCGGKIIKGEKYYKKTLTANYDEYLTLKYHLKCIESVELEQGINNDLDDFLGVSDEEEY